jgi:hypothetical protein
MRKARFLPPIFASCFLLLATGCTKEDSGQDNARPSDEPNSSEVSISSFRTSCGTVHKGELVNPVEADEGDRGEVRVLGPNLVAMKMGRREQIIKLHGLDVPYLPSKRTEAIELLESLSAEGDVYFYPAEPECSVPLEDGSEGVVGHLFSAGGKSFSEALIRNGSAQTSMDVCQGGLISSCYRALEEESEPIETPIPEPEFEGPSVAPGFILWKPVSDSDGRLAVHSLPYGTSVRVDGERGADRGPGNGFGSLARFRRSGCGYGSRVKLELILSDGSKHMFGDKPYAIIPDGCRRWLVNPKGVATPNKK